MSDVFCDVSATLLTATLRKRCTSVVEMSQKTSRIDGKIPRGVSFCFTAINKTTIAENKAVAEPMMTQASHIWDVAIFPSNTLCLMYHKSDYWEPFIPSNNSRSIAIKSTSVKEICHLELWSACMYILLFVVVYTHTNCRCAWSKRSTYWPFGERDGGYLQT